MSRVLQDSTFRQLRDFIYEQSGIYIPDTKKYLLENRLVSRIEGKKLKGFEDYLYLLKYSPDGEEMTRLFDAITTNETSFFREPQQLDLFIDTVVPRVLEEKSKTGNRDLKIWSAACSTGEEPYTIAMMLLEKSNTKAMKVDVYASDISEGALNSAKRAVYGPYSVRNMPEFYLKKYFTNSGQTYALSPSVRSVVKFMNINLVDEKKMRAMQSMDIVFCRNVLIYFDDRAKQKVVSLIYDSLRPGGYLFLGASESLHNVTRAFRPIIINKTLVYQRA